MRPHKKIHKLTIAQMYEQYERNGVYDSPDVYIWCKVFLEECNKILNIIENNIQALDIGTGGSVSLLGFIKHFPKVVIQNPVVSIDVDRQTIKLSSILLQNRKIRKSLYQHFRADACSLCFCDESFHLIDCILSLHEITKKGFAIYEILRTCRMYGYIMLIDSISDFKKSIWQHLEEAKRKEYVTFIDEKILKTVFRKILPSSSLLIKVFQVGRHGTRFFLCVIRKIDEEITDIRKLDKRLAEEAKNILAEIISLRKTRTIH